MTEDGLQMGLDNVPGQVRDDHHLRMRLLYLAVDVHVDVCVVQGMRRGRPPS